MKIKCLIVDDEPIARQIVEKYCAYFPEIEVVGSCGDALQAKKILSNQPIDIIFLDVNMPVLDGFAFVRTLRNQPQIIFTTAYKEYAHEAFNISACDYLLKPFSLERFIQAMDKAKAVMQRSPEPTTTSTNAAAVLYIRSAGKIHKLSSDDLLYAEAQGNNVKLVTAEGTIVTTITFSALEGQLPKTGFIRVHRSFIVNKSKIRVIEGNRIFILDHEIPVGASYRNQFLKDLGMK